jgi:hypothetical protein
VPSNTDHFPLDASPDIASLESDICDRLEEEECDASSRAIEACHKARWMFSGYAGQEAADAWNRAMAVGNTRYVWAAGMGFGSDGCLPSV